MTPDWFQDRAGDWPAAAPRHGSQQDPVQAGLYIEKGLLI